MLENYGLSLGRAWDCWDKIRFLEIFWTMVLNMTLQLHKLLDTKTWKGRKFDAKTFLQVVGWNFSSFNEILVFSRFDLRKLNQILVKISLKTLNVKAIGRLKIHKTQFKCHAIIQKDTIYVQPHNSFNKSVFKKTSKIAVSWSTRQAFNYFKNKTVQLYFKL